MCERPRFGQKLLFTPGARHEMIDHSMARLTMLLVGLVVDREEGLNPTLVS